jgi:hypothetical protein
LFPSSLLIITREVLLVDGRLGIGGLMGANGRRRVVITGAREVASAEGPPVELDRRLPIRRRQIGRESEIASAGGIPLRRSLSRSGSFPRSSSNLANCADGEV